MLFSAVENLHHLDSRVWDTCTWTEYGSYASFVEEVVVLNWDNATGSYDNVLTAKFLQLVDNLRDEGLMTCSQRRYTENVNVSAGVWKRGPISTSKPQSA